MCLQSLGLRANAQYGLSLQIMTIIQGTAAVWTAVKWPLIGQLRAQRNLVKLRQVFWERLWLQKITFVALASIALALGPRFLVLIGTDKQLIPIEWLFVMAANAFLETQFVAWATLISTENRLPSLWPTVASSATTVLLVYILMNDGVRGFAPFVLGPALVGCLFNYWFWAYAGARKLDTSWFRFIFLGIRSTASSKT